MSFHIHNNSIQEKFLHILPINWSWVSIGNTWNDNRLFQPYRNILDFIVHYWWYRLLHFCYGREGREREKNSDYKFFAGIKQHQVLKIMAIVIKRMIMMWGKVLMIMSPGYERGAFMH